jgi:hypothetical protein
VVLVGDGQSAAEIARFILANHPATEIHLVISGYSLRPADNSQFVNEQYYSTSSLAFYALDPERRTRQLGDLRNSNYRVVEEELLSEIYRTVYAEATEGRHRLVVHPYSRLTAVESGPDGRTAIVSDALDGTPQRIRCDEVILATGYARRLDERVFAELYPHLDRDAAGEIALTRSCRVPLRGEISARLYVQGLGEHSFGVGDTLLSLLAFRSEWIVSDAAERVPESEADPAAGLYELIDRTSAGTVVSAKDVDDPVATCLTLRLHRRPGSAGALRGEIDAAHPHVPLLDGRPVTVLFATAAEDASFRPGSVQVSGRSRLLRDRDGAPRRPGREHVAAPPAEPASRVRDRDRVEDGLAFRRAGPSRLGQIRTSV